jgi:ketosteroid isomerase-like protein
MQLRTLRTLLAILSLQSLALCQDVSARDVVRRYLEAQNASMQLNATPQDIERTLDLCSDDIVYEHPAAKAKIEGKNKMRAGKASYLGLTKDAKYKVKILSSKRDVVVAMVSRRFLSRQDDSSWKPGQRSNITVFEIEDGKIRRILDY